jgi:DNA-binding response OmpR family regulator
MTEPKPRILLVEDDINLANMYMLRLRIEGFDPKHCPDGEAALQVAKEFKPHAILLDVMMPKISGFDVLDILRHTPETQTAKILMMSALSQPSDRQKAKDLGADDYLVKSQVVIADVMSALRRHLDMPPAAITE